MLTKLQMLTWEIERASQAHHKYETEVLKHADKDWAEWYARFILEERGQIASPKGYLG